MAIDEYERRVAPAVDVLRRLSQRVLDDVDESAGGVAWWDGQVDFRRRVVLSEYLIDSLNGAAEALLDAALAAQDHREHHYADDTWMVQQWRRVSESTGPQDADFLAALRRGPSELRRERRIESAATHAVSHAMRVLDCLAAAFMIIGAIPVSVRLTDWGSVEKLAHRAIHGSTSQTLEQLGRQGRALQDALFAVVLAWEDYGPPDWLPWLRSTRNGRIHRAGRVHWLLLHGSKKRPEGLLRPFPPNPDLTDVELLSRAPAGNRNALESLRIVRRAPDVVDGAIASMTAFCTALSTALEACWDARREDPSALCQRGAQWQDLERVTVLKFPGYGPEPDLIGDRMHVGEALAKRLRAAHVMGGDRGRWKE